MRME